MWRGDFVVPWEWRRGKRLEAPTALDSATQRANAIWKRLLEAFEPLPFNTAIAEEIDAFVARRTEQGGAID